MAEKMSRKDRAKQFLPFNSLRGFYEMVRLKEKRVTPRKELTSDELERLSFIYNQLDVGKMVKVTYYDVDGYVEVEGLISKIDNVFRKINIVTKEINIDDIILIEADWIISE